MFYYNVTCRVEPDIESIWLEWMIATHIPEVLQTGCFKECKILRLLQDAQANEGSVYAIQYLYQNENDIDTYVNQFAPALKQKTWDKFGESVLAFRTQLEIIHSF